LTLYSVDFLPKAEKELTKLSTLDQRRVFAAIELLRSNPFPPKSSRLKNRDGLRIRVGKIRIIYEVSGNQLLILVLDIGYRREIYRR
jgi:mRNA interferase RelE/StbE